MADFNLRALVQDVLSSTTLVDPSDVADEVYRRVPEPSRPEALTQSLRQFVRLVMGSTRTGPEPVAVYSKNPSRKVAAIRNHWQQYLNSRVFAEGQWKLLRDCTKQDLLFMAADRRRLAGENIAAAERFERLATVVGKGTVGELDASILNDTLGRAA